MMNEGTYAFRPQQPLPELVAVEGGRDYVINVDLRAHGRYRDRRHPLQQRYDPAWASSTTSRLPTFSTT